MTRRQAFTGIGRQLPTAGLVVAGYAGNSRAKANAAAEIEAVGDMAKIVQDLGLRRIAM